MKNRIFVVIPALILTGCLRNSADYLARGDRYFQERRFGDAALNYRKALQSNPESGQAYYKLGRTEIEEGNRDQAIQFLTIASRKMPQNREVRTQLGELCLAAYAADGRRSADLYHQIETAAGELRSLDSGSPDALRLQGELLSMDNKPEEALDLLRRADRVNPTDFRNALSYARVLAQLRQFDEAGSVLRPFVDRDVDSAYDPLYAVFSAMGQPEKAAKVIELKASRHPKDLAVQIELAHHYRVTGQAARGEAVLDHIVASPAIFPGAHMAVGDYWMGIHESDKAAEQYQAGARAAQDDKERVAYWKKSMAAFVASTQSQRALPFAKRILKLNSNDADASNIKAILDLRSGEPSRASEAVDEFKRLVVAQPRSTGYRMNYAGALLLTGRAGDAVNELKILLQAEPGNRAARKPLLEAELRSGQYEPALALANELLLSEPGDPSLQHQRTFALMGLGRTEQARIDLMRQLKDKPESREARFDLALLLIQERKFAKADAAFLALYDSGKDTPSLKGLVTARVAENQVDSAIRFLTKELEKQPDSAPIRSSLAELYARTGHFIDAVRELQKLSEVHPHDGEYVLRIGMVQEAAGQMEQAVESYQRARGFPVQKGPATAYLAEAYYTMGRGRESIAAYREALQTYPRNPVLLNNLANALFESGAATDINEGVRMAELAHSIAPRPEYDDTLGLGWYKLGRYAEARQIFQSLATKAPSNAGFKMHLGMVLLSQGDNQKARETLQAALAEKPSPHDAEIIRSLLEKLG